VDCDNVTIDRLTIHNPPDSPNTDGINPDSCRNVHISNCHIDVGDDCITLKSGSEALPPERRTPCENITITNCTLAHGHGGVVIGSETSGGVRNVVIANCVFTGTDRGLRLKSRRGRGGLVEDIRASNLIMDGVLCPFSLNLYYACGRWGDPFVADKTAQPVDEGTPRFRRITLSHVSARQAAVAAGFAWGLPEQPVEDLTLIDYRVSMNAGAPGGYPDMADGLEWLRAAGLHLRNIRGLRLDAVDVCGQSGPALLLDGAEDVQISNSPGLVS
jgi:polygalacturonase